MKALWFALPLLLACGHTDFSEVVLRPPSAPRDPVPVYLKDRGPDREYYDVALVQAIGSGNESDPEDVVAQLAKRGGVLGCDAIVRLDVTQGSARTHAAGVCVRFVGNR